MSYQKKFTRKMYSFSIMQATAVWSTISFSSFHQKVAGYMI